jgi:hypothetical protein
MRHFGKHVLVALTVCLTTRLVHADISNDFHPDVVACEEALARLTECCPGFEPQVVRCALDRVHEGSCGSYTDYEEDPAISRAESTCILDRECSELVADGICERAQDAKPRRSRYHKTDGDYSGTNSSQAKSERVCP